MAQLPITTMPKLNGIPYIGEADAAGTNVVPSLQYVLSDGGVFVPVSSVNPVPMAVKSSSVQDAQAIPTKQVLRKAKATLTSYPQTLNVVAGANTVVTITPPAGELWRVKMLRLAVIAPSGATSGTHQIAVVVGQVGTSGFDITHSILALISNFGDALSTGYNFISTATATNGKFPTTEQAQMQAIQNIVLTADCPLYLQYLNNTNATQTGTFTIRITREVEYVA